MKQNPASGEYKESILAYLTPVSRAVPFSLGVEDVLGRAAVDGVALEVRAEPAGRFVVKEALGLLEALPLVAGQARVGQLGVEVIEELEWIEEMPKIFICPVNLMDTIYVAG